MLIQYTRGWCSFNEHPTDNLFSPHYSLSGPQFHVQHAVQLFIFPLGFSMNLAQHLSDSQAASLHVVETWLYFTKRKLKQRDIHRKSTC